jgi:hypothetical protein
MEIYSGQSCVDENSIIIISGSGMYTVGNVVGGFPVGSEPDASNCYTLIELLEGGDVTHEITTTHETCLTCYQDESLGFEFEKCYTTDELIVVGATDLGFVPTTGYIYLMNISGLTNCYTSTGTIDPPSVEFLPQSVELFTSCEECGIKIPRSSGAEYEECIICCECGATGGTVNSVSVPHPVWTDKYGTQVTQLNMVVLGGPDGLNA